MGTRTFFLRWCLVFGTVGISAAAELPTPEEVASEYRSGLERLDAALTSRSEEERRRFMTNMNALAERAASERNLTPWLWAARYRREAESLGPQWPALLDEGLEPPEPFGSLLAETRERLDRIRSTGLETLKTEREENLARMKELERDLVRKNRIGEAVEAEKAGVVLEKDKAYGKLKKRLQQFTAKETAKRTGRRHLKPEDEEAPAPPPDAKFPFRKENPAFQAFLESVRVESGGYHAGPSAVILLGDRIRVDGGRGLCVVAVVDGEIRIQDTYDTYADHQESLRLIEDIKKLPYGAFVAMAVRDDATRRFTGSARSALLRLGAAQGVYGLPYRSSYLLIGMKGLPPGQAMERSGRGKIRHDREVKSEAQALE